MIKTYTTYNVQLRLTYRSLWIFWFRRHAQVPVMASSREEAMLKALLDISMMQRMGEIQQAWSIDATDAYVA